MDSSKSFIAALCLGIVLWGALFAPSIANVAPTAVTANATANIGTLKGDFQVTPTGQAHYTIPIDVPPGTAKMQPALSIAYDSTNSNTHNGLLGMGFSIEGLTAITRCPSNKTQNGLIHGVDFTDQDRFCLNGEQLVAVKGAYGGDGTEYRTYIDSKAKIISYGRSGNGPAKFIIWTKGGQVASYGGSPDSQVYALGRGTIATWALNQITDTAGNYLVVRYNKDDLNGAFYPARVDYTGNAAAGLAPYNSVVFSYAARPDNVTSYTAGSMVHLTQRLSRIQTFTGAQLVASYNLNYEISPNSFRSRMASIQRCAADGACLAPTKFTWQKNEEGWVKANQYFPLIIMSAGSEFVDLRGTGVPDLVQNYYEEAKSPHPDMHLYDAWINTGSGLNVWAEAQNFTPPFETGHFEEDPGLLRYGDDTGTRLIDLRGTGRVDILQNAYYGRSDWRYGAYINTGNNWFNAPQYTPPVEISGQGRDEGVRLVRLTGSGLPDIVQSCWLSATDQRWSAWINTGNGWARASNDFIPRLQISHFGVSKDGVRNDVGTRFLDLRGIGLDDQIEWGYLSPQDQRRDAFLNTGTGWVHAPQYAPPVEIANLGRDEGVRFVHLSGSGLPDIVQSARLSMTDERVSSWINTGNGWVQNNNYFLPSNIVNYKITGYDDYIDTGVRFLDLRGTGLDDIVQHTTYEYHEPGGQMNLVYHNWAFVNNGTNWVEDGNYKLPVHTAYFGFGNPGLNFVDLTGSGLPDIVDFVLLKGAWLNKAQKYPDYLVAISDGLGAELDIDYEALSIKNPDIKVYTKEYNAQYPCMDYQGPMYVVYKTTTTANINDPKAIARVLAKNNNSPDALAHTTWYRYIGAKMHHLGFGFLGFHQIVTTDQSTGISKTVTYGQDVAAHNIGEELASETRLSNNTLIASSQNTWESRAFGDGSPNNTYYQNNTKQIISKTFDLNGGLLNTKTDAFIVDAYGNATKITTAVQDNTGIYTTVNENVFTNDPNAWIIGSLTNSRVTVTSPNKAANTRTSSFAYDAKTGLLIHAVASPDDAKYQTLTDYTRDKFGNVVKTTVSGVGIEPRATAVTYDSYGRFITQTTNALNQTAMQTWDAAFGVVTQATDANGVMLKHKYDGFGRLVETDNPDGTVETVNYSSGQGLKDVAYIVTTTKTDAPTKVAYFDQLNRQIAGTVQGFDGQVIWQLTQYDELGRIANQSLPYFAGAPVYMVHFEYDVLGHKTKIVNPDNTATTFSYSGATTTITNTLNQKVLKTFDARNNLTAVTDNLNHATHYDYDAYGNLVALTDSAGNITKIVYDQYGHKTDIYDSDKGHWVYGYDVLGELISQKDALGQVTTLTYDKLGRMIKRTDPAGTSTWEYDSASHGIGKLAKVTGVAGINGQPADLATIQKAQRAGLENHTKVFGYDALSRVAQVTTNINGQAYTSNYSYDKDGRLDVETYPNGLRVKHTYNTLGFLTVSTDGVTGKEYWKLNAVDAAGHILSETHSNGLITNYTYDSKTNLLAGVNTVLNTNLELQKYIFPQQTGLTIRQQHGALLNHVNKNSFKINALRNKAIQNDQYSYDAAGNVLSHKDLVNNLNASYQFDGLNRITQATIGADMQTYQYDDIGNIIAKSDVGNYSYSKVNAGPHAVTGITGKQPAIFTYNANGDQIAATINNVKRTITYTSFSKPLAIVTPNTSVNFFYNADRDSFERQDHSGTKNVTTYYLGDYEVARIDDGKTIITEQKAYIGPNTINIIRLDGGNSKNNSNIIYETLHDNLGSITDIVDQNANIVQHFTYTPFGEQKQTQGQVLANPITHKGFTGHEEIESMNLIHMAGRIYDPMIGRFLSADPTIEAPADPQDLNRYSYCINNPLKYIDPSGYGFFGSLCRSVSNAFQGVCHFVGNLFDRQTVGLILQIAVGAFNPWVVPMLTAAMTAAAGGDLADILKATALVALSEIAWYSVGNLTHGMTAGGWSGNFTGNAESTLLHGVAGGTLSCIEGGGFKDGFLGGAVGEVCAGAISNLPLAKDTHIRIIERSAAAAVIGGTAAAASGGSFYTGAKSAAFAEMFREMAQGVVSALSMRTEDYYSHNYLSSEALLGAMGPNAVVFGIRPLEAFGNFEMDDNFLADHDIGMYHENVFWTDAAGKPYNADYSPTGINADPSFPDNITNYRFGPVYRNVNVTYAAVHPTGFGGANYNLFMHNCQDYSDAVRRNLHIRLLQLWK